MCAKIEKFTFAGRFGKFSGDFFMGVLKPLPVVRALAFSVLLAGVGAGCVENSSLMSKSKSALSQNCALPNSAAVKSIGRKLASESIEVDREFCAKGENYACHERIFSPNVSDGSSTEVQCARVAALGGNVCLKVSRRAYNTRDAATSPDTDPAAVVPGGEYNRSEFVCHQQVLKDGDTYLAGGEGDTLAEALGKSAKECAAISPRVAAAREEGGK